MKQTMVIIYLTSLLFASTLAGGVTGRSILANLNLAFGGYEHSAATSTHQELSAKVGVARNRVYRDRLLENIDVLNGPGEAGDQSSEKEANGNQKHSVVMRALRLPLFIGLALLFSALTLCFYANGINNQGFVNWRNVSLWIICHLLCLLFGYLSLVALWG